MESKELRKGNWVNPHDPEQVLGVMPDCIDTAKHEGLPIGEVEPIPLTEKRLKDFGFKWLNHGLRLNKFCIRQEINGFVIYLSNEAYNFKIDLEYVHTLKNLYYSLVGEELKQQEND